MSQILDLPSGLLDSDLLCEQMRLVSAYLDQPALQHSAGKLSLPKHWVGFEDALAVRLNSHMAEMRLRQIATPEWAALTADSIVWPSGFLPPLDAQLHILQERATAGLTGRIRLPKSCHELWATFKYSVLARNHQAYSKIGQLVATRGIEFPELLERLVSILLSAPSRGGTLNALQHMWGYISRRSSLDPNKASMSAILSEIQMLSLSSDETYLLNSTSLSDLNFWVVLYDRSSP